MPLKPKFLGISVANFTAAPTMNVLEDTISPEEMKRNRELFDREFHFGGQVSATTQLAYARALTRTRDRHCLEQACQLLESLYRQTVDETARRDCLYYMAIAKARLKDYDEALTYLDGILKVEPSNCQARRLRDLVEAERRSQGLLGLALLGGAAAAAVGFAFGIARLSKG